MTILFDTGHKVVAACLDWLRWKIGPPLVVLACLLMPAVPAETATIRPEMTTIVGDTCALFCSASIFTDTGADTDAITGTVALAKWTGGGTTRFEKYDTSDDWVNDSSNFGFLSWCYQPFEQKSKTFIVVAKVGMKRVSGNGLLVVYRLHVDGTEVPGSFTQQTLVGTEQDQFYLNYQIVTMQPGECLSIKRSSLLAVTVRPTNYSITLEEIECERTHHASPSHRL